MLYTKYTKLTPDLPYFPVSCLTTDQGTSQTILSSPNLSSTQFMRPALFRSILNELKYNLSLILPL